MKPTASVTLCMMHISKYQYIIEPAKYVHWDEIYAGSVRG